MTDFTIVKMSETHVKEVAELEKQCFSTPWSETSLLEELNKNNSYFLVAIHTTGQLVGYIGFNFILDEGYITNIAVHTNFRRCGIARNLLQEIIDFSQRRQLKFVSLEVRKSNIPAISLYEKMGFSSVGERTNFYSTPTENALIMINFLK